MNDRKLYGIADRGIFQGKTNDLFHAAVEEKMLNILNRFNFYKQQVLKIRSIPVKRYSRNAIDWLLSIVRQLLLWSILGFILISILCVLPFRWLNPPTTAFMIQASVKHDYPIHYQWLDREEISDHLAIAMIAAEDQKFPSHYGFDFESIKKALMEHRKNRRGASTISQQVAKNLYLWPGRSYTRKLLEAYFTVLIEVFWPKSRILEIYMNIAEFSPGVYGAGAASQKLFSRSASNLTPRQGQLLAAVLPSPKRYSAVKPGPYVNKRVRQLARSIRQLGGMKFLARIP